MNCKKKKKSGGWAGSALKEGVKRPESGSDPVLELSLSISDGDDEQWAESIAMAHRPGTIVPCLEVTAGSCCFSHPRHQQHLFFLGDLVMGRAPK
jgi:hypothetical protein